MFQLRPAAALEVLNALNMRSVEVLVLCETMIRADDEKLGSVFTDQVQKETLRHSVQKLRTVYPCL